MVREDSCRGRWSSVYSQNGVARKNRDERMPGPLSLHARRPSRCITSRSQTVSITWKNGWILSSPWGNVHLLLPPKRKAKRSEGRGTRLVQERTAENHAQPSWLDQQPSILGRHDLRRPQTH